MSETQDTTTKHLTLIGCGNMGSALLSSWIKEFPNWSFTVVTPNTPRIGLPSNARWEADISDAKEDIARTDVLIFAVKPQILDTLCAEMKDFILQEDCAIVSIAAGKTLTHIQATLTLTAQYFKVMPNTPTKIGQGSSVAYTSEDTNKEARLLIQTLFETTGTLHWVEDENLLDAVTALSGSGPAYVYALIDIMAKAGEANGLPHDLAQALAHETVTGAAGLAAAQPDTSATQLREAVTSPGGTTEAALNVLLDGRWEILFTEAISAAIQRGRKLR